MSFTDPMSVTISGTTTSLPRISTGEDESEYASGDGNIHLTANHVYGKRIRRVVRIDSSKIAADVFKPAENVKVSMSHYWVWDLPPAGFTPADALAVYVGFQAMLGASSNAALTKLLGGES